MRPVEGEGEMSQLDLRPVETHTELVVFLGCGRRGGLREGGI